MKNLKRYIIGIFLAAVSLGFALVIAEVFLRVLNSVERPKIAQDRPLFYYAYPGATSMQDAPYSVPKPQGEFRLAVIGDSFSFATDMQIDDAFPKQLERQLRQRGKTSLRVINYGVPGYSAGDAIGAAHRAVAEEADLLLLQITLNDPQRKPITPTGLQESRQFGPMKLKEPLRSLAERWLTLKFVLTRLHNSKTRREYIHFYHDLFENPSSWNFFQGSLNKIRLLARGSGTHLVAVVFPLYGLPLDEEYPFAGIHHQVGEYLERKKIPYLDLFQLYRGAPLHRIQVIPQVDFHPNEIGHRMAAEAIGEWLLQQDHFEQALAEDQAVRKARRKALLERAKAPLKSHHARRTAGERAEEP